MSALTEAHTPTPYGTAPGGGGVRCRCGEDFNIGRSMPDTKKGKPSRRKLKVMEHCWQAYREHYAQEIVRHHASVFTLCRAPE